MKTDQNESPFHRGEQQIQTKLGVRESMERFGRMVIRDHMPEQHREFYQQLPFVLVGHADQKGQPWASILCQPPGFIHSPNNKTLQMKTSPIEGDPLAATLKANQDDGEQTRLGLLGIELPSRRRNRLAAHVTSFSDKNIELEIDQAFGNCPQYIQSRELKFVPEQKRKQVSVIDLPKLDQQAIELIQNADTFFIASYVDLKDQHVSNGADVSHRGGRPGFVRVNDSNSMTIPDYLGNNHFNTFGNISENGKAGLLFLDFESGDILTITGSAKIDWDSPDILHFDGAQRLLQFNVTQARWLKNALPVRWGNPEFSQNSLLTGTWREAEKIKISEAKRNQWLDYKVTSVVQESSTIKSIYLRPEVGETLNFMPGQFLTIKRSIEAQSQIRTYTVSSAPNDPLYRISVKRELAKKKDLPDGVFSNYIHDSVKVGDIFQAKAPNGHFYFDTNKPRATVLMAAGIGITPMISILRQALVDAVKTRHLRPITLIVVARNDEERAFHQEIEEIIKSTGYQINVYWCLTQPEKHLKLGVDYHFSGRPDTNLIEQLIRSSDHDAYICGPAGFMQDTYDSLRKIGLKDSNIYAEAFGPSALSRDGQKISENFAKEALIEITNIENQSTIEQRWTETDGSLLEFMEGHGITPSYGCRSGQCGSCKAKITQGDVAHFMPTGVALEDDEFLLCSAKPTKTDDDEMAVLKISL